ncbi:hypothetical protein VCR26J2_450075 [Vibrio coralliirubri]|nr:hypothetical protein VCR1J2_430057 [Vibrio coralliirubri]CDT87498.1 hypothetical protein VCR26J2_450075 [Vibrio coralliirubri]CDT93869.1 hypothetical protein VCR8J2_490057 [Vibrio coralliirubri]
MVCLYPSDFKMHISNITRLSQDLTNERYESVQRAKSRNILVAIKLIRQRAHSRRTRSLPLC